MDDPINNPRHYQFGQLEAWDIIELAIENTPDPVTAYHQASALKYLLRAARKNGAEDIAKAFAHLKREVARHAVRIPPSPDYDPASVAFRHGDVALMGSLAVSDACRACGADDAPATAVELADADGVSEYGNPVTPGCAVPTADDKTHRTFDVDLTRTAFFYTTDGVYHAYAEPWWRLP